MLEHARQMFKDPSVASIAPTLPHCVREIIKPINFDKAKVIIEYGAGDGAITRELLSEMRPDCRLILIEKNSDFVSALENKYRDPRVKIVHDSAANIENIRTDLKFSKADYILSGIPFSMMRPSEVNSILRETAQILSSDGRFIIYQSLFAIKASGILRAAVNKHFNVVKNKSLIINLPPLYVMEATSRMN